MRGTNGPMDVITRAEFDHSMKDVLTKTDFEQRLAETKSEIVSAMKQAVKENLDDLKVDLLADVESKVTKAHGVLSLSVVRSSDLKDAKNEILATMRRNFGEAIEPLKADFHKMGADLHKMGADLHKMGAALHKVEADLHAMGARIDEMKGHIKMVADGHIGLDEKITSLGSDIRETLKRHERMLDRHDADLYKLRQSGVLN